MKLIKISLGALALGLLLMTHPASAKAAQTAPGTPITNTATATYTDANNQSYTSNSNTVTTTVQNAPVLTITPSAGQTVAPGQTVTDNFTVTNSGNAGGTLTLAGSDTGSATLSNTYVLNGLTTGTCSVATPCSIATLDTTVGTLAVGATITVGVNYVVSTTATPGSTIVTALSGTVTQAAITGPPAVQAVTSATASANDTDTVKADARLDLQKSVVSPASAAANITYTIAGNDGGGFGAKALLSAGNLLGLTNTAGVIAVLDQVPHFSGATVQAALTGAPAVPTLPLGDTGTWYYTTAASPGTSGWSTTYNAAATYIALFVTTTNAGGIVFPSAPAGSTGAGAVTTAQFTATFSTTQPTGNGSADAGSLSNIANSVIGGNPGNAGTPVIAPGIAVDTDYETTTTTFPASTFAPAVTNTTPSTGTNAPGGASNVVTTQSFGLFSDLNGPLDAAAATGSFNGSATVNNQDDLTAVSFACASGSATNDGTTQCTWPTTNPVAVPNTIQNTGNSADTYNIYATAPAGYTVQLFSVTGCPATVPAVLPIAPYGTGCTIGAAISAASASGGSVTLTVPQVIAAGASFNYVAEYKPGTGTTLTPFVPVTFNTIAYGTGATVTAGVPQAGGDANTTYNVIYPGGVVKVTKSQTIVANCPTGATPAAPAGTVCPSGTITYTLAYQNVAPAALAGGGSGVGTEPAFALNGLNVNAGTLVVADDGTVANGWATATTPSTYGVDAVVAPASTTAGTLFTYTPSVALSSGTYGTTKTTGPSKISAQIGGASGTLPPGASGTVIFQVTVR